MLKNIFKKKVSAQRLARATEHEQLQREQAEAKQRAKVVLDRLETRKKALKQDQ